ncbi:hypothetical protein [Corynebacterium callunae]|uniref:hypothetical protein n=1 Tax=Corynebacterium callunae TaxID=1721 RepID=UPI00034BCBA4|nr:hypothetical protein [Corynebacterium callunae]
MEINMRIRRAFLSILAISTLGILGDNTSALAQSSWQSANATETHEEYLARIVNPTDDSILKIHPALNPEVYGEVYDPPQPGECPAVVAVVARGSEQNSQIRPTRYTSESPWTSNGFEERTIRAFFGHLEQYQLETTGNSVMKDVYVMGLSDAEYPAALPLSSQGSSAIEFGASLSSGRESVLTTNENFEAESGCTPQYLLVGYSQGVLVLDGYEAELKARNQYIGSLYIANPALQFDDPTVIGHQPIRGGVLSSLEEPNKGAPIINYCLPGDIVCDRSIQQLSASGPEMAGEPFLTEDARLNQVHLQYFRTEKPWDKEIYATVGSWIKKASN